MTRINSEVRNDIREIALKWHQGGKSIREIAKIIQRSYTIAQYIIKKV